MYREGIKEIIKEMRHDSIFLMVSGFTGGSGLIGSTGTISGGIVFNQSLNFFTLFFIVAILPHVYIMSSLCSV